MSKGDIDSAAIARIFIETMPLFQSVEADEEARIRLCILVTAAIKAWTNEKTRIYLEALLAGLEQVTITSVLRELNKHLKVKTDIVWE
jgi:hypothetical protein